MEWQEEEEVVLEKEYDCIICNTTSPSTESNPIGLVVLLQVISQHFQFLPFV
jgi:E3 ubiquitin-protein ligase UBR3